MQWAPGALSPGRIKRPGHEANHSFPSTVVVNNGGTIPSRHCAELLVIKHRDKFTFFTFASGRNGLYFTVIVKKGLDEEMCSLETYCVT
jgi:hypothetical protein